MFTQLYLNDSFMIRKIIVAAFPAALVAVGMSLAISEPASSQMRGGGMGGATNTTQVYPNNQSSGGGGRGGTNGFYLPMQQQDGPLGMLYNLNHGGSRGGNGFAGGGCTPSTC